MCWRGRLANLALFWLVLLHQSTSCAHQQQEDPPLYEDLLFAQIEKDKPRPGHEFPFDTLLQDEVPGDGRGPRPQWRRPEATEWESFMEGSDSESVGKPNHGRLSGGRLLEVDGRGFIRKNDKAPYATDETIAIIRWACQRVVSMYPGTVPLVIGDLSARRGGRLKPHASHQSGRDADIGYFFKDNEVVKRFKDATPNNLDVEKTWTFLELLLSTHRVEFLFIDRRLQPLLYEEARARGWTEEELGQLFEAPVGERHKHGIIRHLKGHKHHLHVRFRCDKSDPRCK